MEEYWPLVNKLEQAWTGVEASDRIIISNLVSQHNPGALIMVCLVRYAKEKLKGIVGILRRPSRANIVR